MFPLDLSFSSLHVFCFVEKQFLLLLKIQSFFCTRLPESRPKYNLLLYPAVHHSLCYTLTGGGHWDFRFCGFGYFLDRFLCFCAKKIRFFGFGVYYGLRIYRFSACGFRFSRKIQTSFRI